MIADLQAISASKIGVRLMSEKKIMRALIKLHGRTYAEEIGIELHKGTPAPLFQTLVAALLFSARISADLAVAAAQALFAEGWTTSRKMLASSWAERTRVLNKAGYARYDESTSRMLGETASLLEEKYEGDLRQLREKAERDPARERRLLKECKGIGDVGVDIFFREVQSVWQELEPFFDQRSLQTAAELGLPAESARLAALAPGGDVARLAAALTRLKLQKDGERVRLTALTKDELMNKAAEKGVSGRSRMTKAELVEALSARKSR
ncbi:MAG: endonuclease [Thermoleophilia bacterium]